MPNADQTISLGSIMIDSRTHGLKEWVTRTKLRSLVNRAPHEPTLLKRSIPSADSAANDVPDGWPRDVHHAADDFWLVCWAK